MSRSLARIPFTLLLSLVLSMALSLACAGAARPPAAPSAPPDPPALVAVRSRYKSFVGSPGTAQDFDALAQSGAAARARIQATAARAEADLLVLLAALHLAAAHLDALDGTEDLMAATVLPLGFDIRPLDGESSAAYRDRLCQGEAGGACTNVLPDFWNAALVYAAAARLAERARLLSGTCACAARYAAELKAAVATAEAARVHDTDQRPGWPLEQDHLVRSAFATPEWPPGDTRVHVKLAELLPAKRKPLAARLGELRAAAPRPPENAGALLELDAAADTKLADVGQVAAAARDAGFTGILFIVRVAAPPNPRGFLRVDLVGGRAPKGATTLALPASSKKDAMQTLVDQIDAAYGTSEAAHVVFVVK